MRAKFVNEKFTDKTDPVKDMGIGLYPKMLVILKACLEYNKRSFSVPLGSNVIQFYLIPKIQKNEPLSEDEIADIRRVGKFLVRKKYLDKSQTI
jgi:hypothetical protein